MKISKLGIKMYELEDPLQAGNGVGQAVNALRVEINKIAVLLDDLATRIEELEDYKG